jgi:hypothetical protein
MQLEQMKQSGGSMGPHDLPPNDMPQCCGTGCAVCVLDYPELFSNGSCGSTGNQIDSETLAMLEAIEQAQAQAQLQTGQIVAEIGSELQ